MQNSRTRSLSKAYGFTKGKMAGSVAERYLLSRELSIEVQRAWNLDAIRRHSEVIVWVDRIEVAERWASAIGENAVAMRSMVASDVPGMCNFTSAIHRQMLYPHNILSIYLVLSGLNTNTTNATPAISVNKITASDIVANGSGFLP